MKREFYSDPFPPKRTGLHVMIWIGTKENGGQPRLWVKENGKYHPVHFQAHSRFPEVNIWINRNMQVLVDYWNGAIDTCELLELIVKYSKSI